MSGSSSAREDRPDVHVMGKEVMTHVDTIQVRTW